MKEKQSLAGRILFRSLLFMGSAVMLPLCFPPHDEWPLIIPVFTLFFLALHEATQRESFYFGILHGMFGFGLTLFWFLNVFANGAFFFFFILAAFTAVFALLFWYLSRRILSPLTWVLSAATLWTAVEFFRCELFFLRFPWITPGTALGPTFLSPILGVYGASFLIIAASAAFVHRKTFPLALGLSGIVFLLGFFRPGTVVLAPGEGIEVRIVQDDHCSTESYLRMSKGGTPQLIIWPEYSIPYDVRKSPNDMAQLVQLCAEENAMLVFGTKTMGDRQGGAWHNTALTLDSHGVVGEYFKARPVHFFDDGLPGKNFSPIHSSIGNFGTPICFDCDYTEVTRRLAANGAEFFAVPSYDARSWSATQHLQHGMLFRLRAAENGRWLACASGSGVSQVIDPHGNVVSRLPLMEPGTIRARIGLRQEKTFFTRIGWLFPWFTLAASIWIIASAIWQRNKTKTL